MNVTNRNNEYSVNSLSPKLKEIVIKGRRINRMGQLFCRKDFPEIKNDNTFRQNIYRLRKQGWIITPIRGWLSHYRIRGEHVGNERRTVTHEGMGVGTNMQEIINEASKQIPAIHNIKMKFPSKQLHKNAIKNGMTTNPSNNGILLDKLTLSRDIYAKISIYPEIVSVDIGCT